MYLYIVNCDDFFSQIDASFKKPNINRIHRAAWASYVGETATAGFGAVEDVFGVATASFFSSAIMALA